MADVDRDRLLNLIGRTYDAALDEKLWAGLAPEIAGTFNASSVSLRLRNSRTGRAPLLACTDNMRVVNVQEYSNNHYWRLDKWANRAAEIGMSKVLISKDLVSDDELERSEWYWDWLRKADVFYIVGAVFPFGEDEIFSLGIHRPRRAGNFEEEDKGPVTQFLPHLQRALQMRRRLSNGIDGIERAATVDALERTGIATLVVAEDGLILHANAQAESLLRRGDAIRSAQSRLRTSDHRAGKQLAAAIDNAIKLAAGGSAPARKALAIPRANRLPLTVLVAPFRPARDGLGAPVPAAIIFARDPEWPTASQEALQSMFGLTATEASIASALAGGQSLNDIAGRYRITLNTIRTHIKNIFIKTGTNRQPELVALVRGTVAFLQSR
jgi:DNA-binding CsgD family transcriptional regulator